MPSGAMQKAECFLGLACFDGAIASYPLHSAFGLRHAADNVSCSSAAAVAAMFDSCRVLSFVVWLPSGCSLIPLPILQPFDRFCFFFLVLPCFLLYLSSVFLFFVLFVFHLFEFFIFHIFIPSFSSFLFYFHTVPVYFFDFHIFSSKLFFSIFQFFSLPCFHLHLLFLLFCSFFPTAGFTVFFPKVLFFFS